MPTVSGVLGGGSTVGLPLEKTDMRLIPPQISLELPAHGITQELSMIFCAVLWKTFPQKHWLPYSSPAILKPWPTQ